MSVKMIHRKESKMYSLSVVHRKGIYVERARWNWAWHHSQAKVNDSIKCLSKIGQKVLRVTYKLLTQSIISCVVLPDDGEHGFATHILLA